MATWEDGPEYAPEQRPTRWHPAPVLAVDPARVEPPSGNEPTAQRLAALAESRRASLEAPTWHGTPEPALATLAAPPVAARDPRESFALARGVRLEALGGHGTEADAADPRDPEPRDPHLPFTVTRSLAAGSGQEAMLRDPRLPLGSPPEPWGAPAPVRRPVTVGGVASSMGGLLFACLIVGAVLPALAPVVLVVAATGGAGLAARRRAATRRIALGGLALTGLALLWSLLVGDDWASLEATGRLACLVVLALVVVVQTLALRAGEPPATPVAPGGPPSGPPSGAGGYPQYPSPPASYPPPPPSVRG